MFTDKPTPRKPKSKFSKSLSMIREIESDQKKLDAVQSYVILGDLSLTSKAVAVPRETLKAWKNTSWWRDLEQEVRSTETLVLASNLKKQVDKAMSLVADRLENGDYLYNPKTGEMVRKPVSLKDAHKVVTDFIDRRHKLTSHEENKILQKDIKDHLQDLAKTFEQFAVSTSKKPVVEVTDVVFVTEEKREL